MSQKKLVKKIEGSEIIFILDGDELRYDTVELPEEIKARLVPFGTGHKLGDSAASSKTPEEMKAALQRTWDAMMANSWTCRQPSEPKEKAPKISAKTIAENLKNLPEEQQEAAKALLASMGIAI